MTSSPPSTFKALHLTKPKTPFTIATVDTPSTSPTEVLIRLSALAINPVDWKVQDSGYFIETYPAILGEDLSGTIVAVGSSVTRFKPGDRVLAHAHFLWTKENKHGGFQEMVVVPEISVAKIPESMKESDATVLPLAISTAAAGLYQPKSQTCLGLDLPSANPTKSGKTLLVWGGSSSVGTAAIQLAVASGVDVVTTCSKRNFELVEGLGAKAFDYASLSVVGDLVEELKKGEFVGGYDGGLFFFLSLAFTCFVRLFAFRGSPGGCVHSICSACPA
ncbi:L-threonine 3-dehydrogenase [subsurface metagenome]